MVVSQVSFFRRFLAASSMLAASLGLRGQELPPPAAETPVDSVERVQTQEPIRLEKVDVKATTEDAGYDATGMGSYEFQLRDSSFSNDMISAEAVEDDPVASELASELVAIATPSAVDLATGDSRVGLRGFPTPLLTNGFARMGGVDILNTARTIVIQGALVPVLGRAAPGGIQDFWTNRPRPAKSRRVDFSVSSMDRMGSSMEINGPAVPKRVWHRLAADWSRRTGPEKYSSNETCSVNGAVTWRHSAAVSTLFSVDYTQTHALAAPAIPEYRVATGEKIVGPYLPLAGFNALGPEAPVRRRSMVANLIVDAQPHPKIAVRAGLEAWWRRIDQDRFTTGLMNLATGHFEGIREPRHSEQPQSARVARGEATGRFTALGAEHKLMFAVSHTLGSYYREERALSVADRNAQPESVRIFNPAAPNYSRPRYGPELYDRILTDRDEQTRYTAIEISERMGIAKGRLVLTTGLRQDLVGLKVHDRRVGLAPELQRFDDGVDQLTYHVGANYQAIPSRLLVFATASSAFNPSTRVDLRTSRIQENETTRGYEGGVKARFAPRQIEFTAAFFSFFNQDISRRNPLYDDPVFDANHTQPQLAAAGEERFTGGKLEGRWKPSVPLAFTLRGTYVRAVTTASPDLPEEVGRQLTRFPPYNLGVGGSYVFTTGRLKGLSLSSSCSVISGFVANYEDKQRHYRDYPSYTLFGMGVNYSKRIGKLTHGCGLAVRNVFDLDLLNKLSRLGAGREFSASYRLMW